LAPKGAPATPFAESLESIENRKTHAFAAGKNLVFSDSDLPAPPNFRKLIFGGIEEKQRVEGGQRGFFSRGDARI
jgi:hypothetical protein